MGSLMSDDVSLALIGQEQNPLIVIDNFFPEPQRLVEFASNAGDFKHDKNDFYPGVRRDLPDYYNAYVLDYVRQRLLMALNKHKESTLKSTLCALSIANQTADTLLPIQRIPHFDTFEADQWALLHYLCKDTHGGTGFFRHRHTGFERITQSRSNKYLRILEDEAVTKGLPEKRYVAGSSQLFEMYHQVEALFNRAIFYPSNLLHSGLITDWHATDIASSRLTANTFIKFDSLNQS
jgi:hypothetical protein